MSMAAMGLEEATINTVKATAPLVAENADAITTRFYNILFEEHPEVKSIFNMSHHRPGKDGKTSPQVTNDTKMFRSTNMRQFVYNIDIFIFIFIYFRLVH